MNDSFNEQKEILSSLKHEISLLHQQVDYLIRNEKDLGLLDLDVMMNRTHRIYDQLCSINIGHPATDDDQELDIAPEMLHALFGVEEPKEEEAPTEEETPEEEEIPVEEENPVEEAPVEEETPSVAEEIPEKEEEPKEEVADYGFIFKMEPLDETPEELPEETQEEIPEETPEEIPEETPVETPEETNIYTTGDEIEMVIPHLDFPVITEEGEEEEEPEEIPEEESEETIEEEPEEVPEETMEEEPEKPQEEIAYEPIIFGDMEEKEEVGFEIEETLGEKMQHEEDHSLAAMLQHQSVHSLKSAIGINDKFLLVNELFNGSMEKYNRSMENLDDLKTLNGALIYLNELRIELQWNSNNEAYKKLLELVHRKFEQ